MVRVAGETGDYFSVSRLHGARGAPQRHDPARATERDMVEPAGRKAKMLCQSDCGVGSERKAGDREAVDVLFFQSRTFKKIGQASRQPPMRGSDGVAHIGNGERYRNRHPFVAAPTHGSAPSGRKKRGLSLISFAALALA